MSVSFLPDFDKLYQDDTKVKNAITADELEVYAENLIQTQKNRGRNVYPVQKAKEKLGFEAQGNPVLIASDASKIRIHPQTKDMFYRPAQSRERMSINWMESPPPPQSKKDKYKMNKI